MLVDAAEPPAGELAAAPVPANARGAVVVPSNDETKIKWLVPSVKKIELIDEKAMPLMVLVALVVGGTTDDWAYLAVYRVLVIAGPAANTSETTERNTIAESTKEAAASDDGTRGTIGVVGLETTRRAWCVDASTREEKSNKLHQSK